MNKLKSGNYYTAEDLALKAGIGRATVYRWLKKNKLKPTYIGDLLRFHEKDVRHLFKKNKTT
jgi:excisionase family DNA binding protein